MRKEFTTFLWILLAVDLLLLFPGFKTRVSNENSDRSIVTAAGFEEFSRTAGTSGAYAGDLLERLKSSGVRAVAVRYPGTDASVFRTIRSKDLEIMLILQNPPGFDDESFEKLDKLIGQYGIRYITFEGGEVTGFPGSIERMAGVIRKNNIIFTVTEPPSQAGYLPLKGIESLIGNTDYSINREYAVPDEDLLHIGGDELFYRWIRCVADRNIRFIYIRPLKNQGCDAYTNLRDTLRAVGEFTSYITKRGYSLDIPLARLSSSMPGGRLDVPAAVGLYILIILFIAYLPKHPWSGRQFLPVLSVPAGMLALSACVAVFTGLEAPLFLAFIAAVVFPSLSGLLLLKFVGSDKQRPPLPKVAGSIAIMTGTNLIGGYFIVSVMGDIRFTMNLLSFEGVVPAFIIPPAVFILLYPSVFTNYRSFAGSAVRFLKSIPLYLKVIIFSFLILAIYIYLARSGNNSVIPASPLELSAREFLEKHLFARPRFKEFIIGYPSLFIFACLYQKYREAVPLLLPGIGAVIGGVSVVNSFCHGFTAVRVSLFRTLYGLALGLPIGALATLALHIFLARREKKPAAHR